MHAIFGRACGHEVASHRVGQDVLSCPRIPDTEHFINVDRLLRQTSFAAAERGRQRAWIAHLEHIILNYITEDLGPSHG
jgi:hypothetical protein